MSEGKGRVGWAIYETRGLERDAGELVPKPSINFLSRVNIQKSLGTDALWELGSQQKQFLKALNEK